MNPVRIALVSAVACLGYRAPALVAATPHLQDGDVVFQSWQSAEGRILDRAAPSRFNQVGLVLLENGLPFVLDAAGPVRLIPFAEWAVRGRYRHFVVKRLRDADRRLTPEALARLKAASKDTLGRPYDPAFDDSDSAYYGAELVWKLYQRAFGLELGQPLKLRELKLGGARVRQALAEHYGVVLPLDQPVITPGGVFDSELLAEVGRG
ncbi:MAG TPA: YiiX/YebB-like N1pC/P60 family cysteine hydrolase [Thermoanaerobaculia bacterium]|nr:YiiX/YebB-like N1pC/P60 family cysteine hydrolase [Thermoanaerobaculia bacterium]